MEGRGGGRGKPGEVYGEDLTVHAVQDVYSSCTPSSLSVALLLVAMQGFNASMLMHAETAADIR